MEDAPETKVYAKLLYMHLELCRKDFEGKERKDMFDFIKRFETIFPDQCKVFTDRFPGEK